MNNKEILDNAPEGATHVGPWVYKVSGKNIPLENGLRNHKQEGLRSLADIKRIAELETYKNYYQELVEARGYYGITHLLVADTGHKLKIAELEKERDSLLRLISYVRSIVFSKVKCSYVSFKRPLEELLKD